MIIKNKCDIIIPVYNAPDWVKLCVYSVIKNTPQSFLNKIYLMNDNSNSQTLNTLRNLKNKYGNVIELITNEENLGFVRNCNKALSIVEAEYVLLLNSDCLLSSNSIPKLITHMQEDTSIGLICPLASNAANITLPIFEGFSYTQMDALLEKKFKGINFDACTVVGNCLMMSRACLDSVGLLDEIYGMGYGEETDYQFKAMEKGFKAKIAIDTYVFHKAEVSFGTSKEKQEKLEKNRKIFFDRWADQYHTLEKEYSKNDPIKFIQNNLTEEDKKIFVDTVIFLPIIVQNAGGCHVVVDLVNYLNINGFSANIVYEEIIDYHEAMLFNPIHAEKFNAIECNQIVSTIWDSTFKASQYARTKKIPLISFVQGYEVYFENGVEFGNVALSYKLADHILTISKYLQKKLKDVFSIDSKVICNGINQDLLLKNNNKEVARNITLFLRGNTMKGDFLLLDLLKIINNKSHGLNINVIYVNPKIIFPFLENNDNTINFIKGPISRMQMSDILNETDIYVDASFNEGFGLLALEALYAGAVAIVSNSFGVNEYIKENKNGFIIKEVNNVDAYYEKIELLLKENKIFDEMKNSQEIIVDNFDYDNTIEELLSYFSEKKEVKEEELSEYEKELLKNINDGLKKKTKTRNSILKRVAFYIARKTPEGIKNRMKPVITSLYQMYDHSQEVL